jgi:hypothetical protein
VATAGAADADREVAAKQPAAAVGEYRRTFDQARPLLLAVLAEIHLTRRLLGGMLHRIALLPSSPAD